MHHWNRIVFQISHQQAICILQPSRDQYIHGSLLHISFFSTTWALEKSITIVGTMKHDQNGIPKELQPVVDREERSVMHVYNTKEKIMLVSYIDKKKSNKKNVLVSLAMHNNVKITKDQQKKPSIHIMYDHTKGGADVVNLFVKNTFNRNKIWKVVLECTSV